MEEKEGEIDVLLDGLDETNISSILSKWKEIVTIRKRMDELEEALRDKVKIFLKEKGWNRYMDEDTQISVSLTTLKKESIDREQLKAMLTEQQYAQVSHVTSFEKLQIVTEEARQQMKKFIRPAKKVEE